MHLSFRIHFLLLSSFDSQEPLFEKIQNFSKRESHQTQGMFARCITLMPCVVLCYSHNTNNLSASCQPLWQFELTFFLVSTLFTNVNKSASEKHFLRQTISRQSTKIPRFNLLNRPLVKLQACCVESGWLRIMVFSSPFSRLTCCKKYKPITCSCCLWRWYLTSQ